MEVTTPSEAGVEFYLLESETSSWSYGRTVAGAVAYFFNPLLLSNDFSGC